MRICDDELGIASGRRKLEGGRLNDESTATAIASLTRLLLGAPAMTAAAIVQLATDVIGSLGIDVAHSVSNALHRWR